MKDTPGAQLLSSYVSDVLERIRTLEELSVNLAELEYVSPEAPELVRAFGNLASDYRAELFIQWNIYQDTRDSICLTMLRAVDEAVRRTVGDIRLPARATSDRVPGVLTRLVAAKLSTLQPQAGVILRPQWNYNYKVHRHDVHSRYRAMLKEVLGDGEVVDKRFSGLPNPLYVISFPILERESVHLHSVLGHELGHIISRDFKSPADAEIKFKREQKELLGLSERRVLFEPLTSIDQARSARDRAIREYSADAASVYLFGISAVLGAAQVALAKNLGGKRQSTALNEYPAWGARLYYMIQLAKDESWLSFDLITSENQDLKTATVAVRDRLEQIQRWVGDDPAAWTSEGNQWIRAGHESAAELLPAIRKYLKDHFQDAFPSAQATYASLPSLFGRMKNGIPPDNRSQSSLPYESSELEEIFVASWWYRLHSCVPVFEGNDLSVDSQGQLEKLRKLALKAIESVDFMRRYYGRIAKVYDKGVG